MLHLIGILIATSVGSSDGRPRFTGEGERVVVYGASSPKSVRAENKWNRLNLSPQGVEPAPLAKRL